MFDYSLLVYFAKYFGVFAFGGSFIGVVLYVLLKGEELEKNSDIPLRDEEKKGE